MSSSVVISICGSWVSIEPHVVAASRVVVDILSSPRFLKVCCSLPLCLIELSRTPGRILDESPTMFWRHHIAHIVPYTLQLSQSVFDYLLGLVRLCFAVARGGCCCQETLAHAHEQTLVVVCCCGLSVFDKDHLLCPRQKLTILEVHCCKRHFGKSSSSSTAYSAQVVLIPRHPLT